MPAAPSTTSETSSGKHKRDTPLAFYAVKIGRVPGVYQTWNEANEQIQGFKGAIYKKFATHAEAEAMVVGTASTTTPKQGKPKYYGVAVGHVPGVYTDYTAVQAQIKGATGIKHKAFSTYAEAQAYVHQFRRDKSAAISLRGDLSAPVLATAQPSNSCDTSTKKQKTETTLPKSTLTNGDNTYEPGLGPLPPDAEDGFDRTLKLDVETGQIKAKTDQEQQAMKLQPTGDFTGPIVVYTDGSSLGNGCANAVAGVGVYFGPSDSRNVSEPLRGDRQTNQRAELTAVARALDHIPIDRSAEIVTDSNYAIKCLTEWFQKWEKAAWRNAVGKPVENRDLIEPIIARIRERDCCRAKTMFRWIKGHANDAGNCAADELAVQGSRTSTPELRGQREFSLTLNTPTRLHYFKEEIQQREKERQTAGPGHQGQEKVQAIPESSTTTTKSGDDDYDNHDSAGIEQIFADLAAEQLGAVTSRPNVETSMGMAAREDAPTLVQAQPFADDARNEERLGQLLRGELSGGSNSSFNKAS